MNQQPSFPPEEPEILKQLRQEMDSIYDKLPFTRLSQAIVIGIAIVLVVSALVYAYVNLG